MWSFLIFLIGSLQQEEVTAERRAKRAEVFVAPAETAAPSVDEKRRRKREKEREGETGEEGSHRKQKKRKTADAESES